MICRAAGARHSSPYWENEVRDLVALDAHSRVAEQDIVTIELAEEWSAVAHDDGYEVDSHLVEQAEFEALSSNDPARHGNVPVSCNRLGLVDGSLHPIGDEGERCPWMVIRPVRRD